MKLFSIILMAGMVILSGCSKGVDTETPVADLEKEASTLSVDDLKAKAVQYKDAIEAKMAEIEPITAQLKEIPLMEQMGDEASALKADIATLTADLNALKERLDVYLEALKAQGESVKEYMN